MKTLSFHTAITVSLVLCIYTFSFAHAKDNSNEKRSNCQTGHIYQITSTAGLQK